MTARSVSSYSNVLASGHCLKDFVCLALIIHKRSMVLLNDISPPKRKIELTSLDSYCRRHNHSGAGSKKDPSNFSETNLGVHADVTGYQYVQPEDIGKLYMYDVTGYVYQYVQTEDIGKLYMYDVTGYQYVQPEDIGKLYMYDVTGYQYVQPEDIGKLYNCPCTFYLNGKNHIHIET